MITARSTITALVVGATLVYAGRVTSHITTLSQMKRVVSGQANLRDTEEKTFMSWASKCIEDGGHLTSTPSVVYCLDMPQQKVVPNQSTRKSGLL